MNKLMAAALLLLSAQAVSAWNVVYDNTPSQHGWFAMQESMEYSNNFVSVGFYFSDGCTPTLMFITALTENYYAPVNDTRSIKLRVDKLGHWEGDVRHRVEEHKPGHYREVLVREVSNNLLTELYFGQKLIWTPTDTGEIDTHRYTLRGSKTAIETAYSRCLSDQRQSDPEWDDTPVVQPRNSGDEWDS